LVSYYFALRAWTTPIHPPDMLENDIPVEGIVVEMRKPELRASI